MPIYNAVMALGHGGDDTAALYSVLGHMTATAPKRPELRRPGEAGPQAKKEPLDR